MGGIVDQALARHCYLGLRPRQGLVTSNSYDCVAFYDMLRSGVVSVSDVEGGADIRIAFGFDRHVYDRRSLFEHYLFWL